MKWHHIKIFDYEYAFCPTKKEWDTYWKKIGSEPQGYLKSSGRATFFKVEDHHGNITPRALVTIAERKDVEPIQVATLLAHEAVHIKQDMCEHIGEQNISSEMEAYIVQSVLQDLMYDYKDTRL